MSENLINPISSVSLADAGTNTSPIAGQGQTDLAAVRLLGSGKADPAALKPGAPAAADAAALKSGAPATADSTTPKAGAPALPVEPAPRPKAPLTNGSNVEVHFRVDRQTKNITVFIVDRDSKRVLRSIPPEELNKLQPGDLVEMTG